MGSAPFKHVLFYFPLNPGNLMLAEMDDQRLCILRDDRPTDQTWDRNEMAKAVAAFQEMKTQLTANR